MKWRTKIAKVVQNEFIASLSANYTLYFDYYFWQSFANAYSMQTHARALYKPLKFEALHFVYAFA